MNQHIQLVSEYLEFLASTQGLAVHHFASQEPLEFISFLKAASRDTYDNIAALARYGLYTEDRQLYLTALQFGDGGEVMDNLYDRLAQTAGTQKRDQIFQGIQLPFEDSQIQRTHWPWPIQWEAAFAILQGKSSGFWVHAQDNRYRYKTLQVGGENDVHSLGFDTECQGPIDDSLAAGGLVPVGFVERGVD